MPNLLVRKGSASFTMQQISEAALIQIADAAQLLNCTVGTLIRAAEDNALSELRQERWTPWREYLMRSEIESLVRAHAQGRTPLVDKYSVLTVNWFNPYGLRPADPANGKNVQCVVRPVYGLFFHGYVTRKMGFRGDPDLWIGHLHQVVVIGNQEQPSVELFCRRDFPNPVEAARQVEDELLKAVLNSGYA